MLCFYFDNKSNQICQTLEPTVIVGAASGGQFAGKPAPKHANEGASSRSGNPQASSVRSADRMAIRRRLKGKKADQISADLVAAFLYCDRSHKWPAHKLDWPAPQPPERRSGRRALCGALGGSGERRPADPFVVWLTWPSGRTGKNPLSRFELQVLLVVRFPDSFLCLKLASWRSPNRSDKRA